MRKKRLLLPLTFLALFFLFLRPPTDPDLGWHLRYGQTIIEEHKIPWADTFSHTMAGHRWADSYWLSEVLIFLGYKYLSFLGLSILFSLLTAVALFLSLAARKNWPKDFFRLRTALLAFAGVCLLLPFVGTRPQTLSLFFFALFLFLLKRQQWGWLPLLFLLWANLHAGFLLGLLALWLFWLGRTLSLWRQPKEGKILATLAASIIATVTTFINPYGPFLWQTILKDAASLEIRRGIVEWASPDFHTDLGFFFILFALFSTIIIVRALKKLSPAEILLFSVFLLLSFSAIRHIPLFTLITIPLLAKTTTKLKTPYLPSFYRFWGWLTLFGVSLYTLYTFAAGLYRNDWAPFELKGIGGYPESAVQFLQKNPPAGNVLNAYGWGGYLLWRLPKIKTFIDGRMCGWRQGDKESLFKKYDRAVSLKPGWQEVLEEYKISWVLLNKELPLTQALILDSQWEKVYEDGLATILRRTPKEHLSGV